MSGAKDLPVPIVVVSQCLGFAAVRYNGMMLLDDFVTALRNHVQFVQVCPEVGIGLGVPRDPVRIVVENGERRLIQPSTKRDLTASMRDFSSNFLGKVGDVDGFILKSRSPSCGIKDVKNFSGSDASGSAGKSAGIFAEAVQGQFPNAAIEDEGRLTNFELRHHFLVRLFANARLRAIEEKPARAALVQFHTDYKLQWMAYSATGLTRLGQIVANQKTAGINDAIANYRKEMSALLNTPARSSNVRNAVMHAFGYLSDNLQSREKKMFLGLLDDYKSKRVPLSAVLTLLQSWVIRFEQPYLLGQRLFDPYPRALMDLRHSGQ